MLVAGIAVLLSFGMFLGVLAVLVLVRRGDAPRYRASPEYDACRREAVRLMAGTEAETGIRPWYRKGRRNPNPDDPLREPFRSAAAEALRIAIPTERQVRIEPDGTALLSGGVRILPEVSTADLRQRARDGSGLEIGLVLVNPEPPGNYPRRVSLPVQILFPALERAGRSDLVERFRGLAERIR
ncbi:MAG: hypothetical protein ACREMK_03060 [Gemmatimonadota bacterium]